MGYIVTQADIPNLPLKTVDCSDCGGDGGRYEIVQYNDKKERQVSYIERTCDSCYGTGKQEIPLMGLETRRESFTLSSHVGDAHMELPYEALDVLEVYVKYLRDDSKCTRNERCPVPAHTGHYKLAERNNG